MNDHAHWNEGAACSRPGHGDVTALHFLPHGICIVNFGVKSSIKPVITVRSSISWCAGIAFNYRTWLHVLRPIIRWAQGNSWGYLTESNGTIRDFFPAAPFLCPLRLFATSFALSTSSTLPTRNKTGMANTIYARRFQASRLLFWI